MTLNDNTQSNTSDNLGIYASDNHDLWINPHSLKLYMESNSLRVKEA